MHTPFVRPSILSWMRVSGRSLPLWLGLMGVVAAPAAAHSYPHVPVESTTQLAQVYTNRSSSSISESTVIVIDGEQSDYYYNSTMPFYSDQSDRYYLSTPSQYPSTVRWSTPRWEQHRSSPTITNSRIEDSVLINPTIIDSRIEDSVLINPRFEDTYRPRRSSTYSTGGTRPSCLVMAHLRTACQ
ncbi:MAG TPA: hypothetical protein V6D20_02700 [Candidatus Obscuribacterales bacterium]